MKQFKYILIILLMMLFIPVVKAEPAKEVTLYLFHSKLCSHCQAEREFLSQMKDKYPYLVVKEYEISEPGNKELMNKIKELFNNDTPLVPYTTIGNRDYVGFSSIVESQIEQSIIDYSSKNYCNKTGVYLEEADNTYCGKEDVEDIEDMGTLKIPIIGIKVKLADLSLPIITFFLGILDGFNPCAMWVLLFLITMLVGMKNKKRMWALGLTFLVVSALIYLFFMMVSLEVIKTSVNNIWIRIAIAAVAVIGGAFNIRSYFKAHESGCEVVDTSKRKKIIAQIKKFTTEKSFVLALIGVVVLAASVNLIELACSAGLPVTFLGILSQNNLNAFQYWLYILLYIFFFLLDDIIVFTIAMVSFKVTGISTKYTKYSHLIGGIIMLLIGILLVLKPEWLSFNFK